ncbi:hypothetical protein N431DRAFT_61692 [Stipitochalara longipes BDJ]|nr:hypothetical protein N431DRAFT_61692 [Stipitochalara longipes BDJ]
MDAIKRLLTNAEASVNNINAERETPLHVAARHYQAEICALLIREGANCNARDFKRYHNKTPFGSACYPGSRSLLGYKQSISTLRVFLSSGEEIADVATRGHLFDLVLREGDEYIFKKRAPESILPSQWLLRDVVPSVEPYLLGEHWLEKCLLICIRAPTYHPCFEDTLQNCTITSVRNVLIIFIYTLRHDELLDERKHKEFQLLVNHANGLSFIHNHRGKTCSPTSIALECGNSFLNFRELLRASRWDISELIEGEVSMQKHGWKEDTILTLFEENFTPYIGPTILGGCKSCRCSINPLQCCWLIRGYGGFAV